MYIYKISDKQTDKVYIGVDTRPKEKLLRWKSHLRQSRYLKNNNKKLTKFYKELAVRPEDFYVEIIHEDDDIYELFCKEIELIEKYDSYRNGYNSTRGGDGFKSYIKNNSHYAKLYNAFSLKMKEFNEAKWGSTTLSERRDMIRYLHSKESNLRRSKTIKDEWAAMTPSEKSAKLMGLDNYRKNNKEKVKSNAQRSSDIARELNKKITTVVDKDTGEHLTFNSCAEANAYTKTKMYYLKQIQAAGKEHKKWRIILND